MHNTPFLVMSRPRNLTNELSVTENDKMLKIERVDNFYTKCAEIHCRNKNSFIISCNYCALRTEGFEEFQSHFEKNHYYNLRDYYNESLIDVATNDSNFSEDKTNQENQEYSKDESNVENGLQSDDKYERKKEDIYTSKDEYDEFFECKTIFVAENEISELIYNGIEESTDIASNIYEHIVNEETENSSAEENLECEYCRRFFPSSATLISHVCLNADVKPLKCGICHKGCKSRSKLKDHLKAHLAEKPFKCNFCEKTFSYKSNRNVHQIRHTNNRRYKCDQCTKAFYSSCELRNHKRHHNNERSFVCEICGNAYRHLWVLKKHRLTHGSKEKLLPCPQCPKKFANKDNLRNHKKIHNSINKFQCEICSATFKQKGYLNTHLKRFHKLLCESGDHVIHFEKKHYGNDIISEI